MKTTALLRSLGVPVAAFTLALASADLAAQAPAPATAIQLATPEIETFGLARLAGRPVLASNQEQLSTIADFLINPQSGRVALALVPSGSDTFRLVPLAALQAGADNFVLRIDRAQWDKVGTITAAELKSRLNLNAEYQQRITQQFSLAQPLDSQGLDMLVRATSLRGQAVRSGNDQVGTIEDVAIDLPRQVSAAIVKADGSFGSNPQKFLLSFPQLQAGTDGTSFTTTLARPAFQAAQSSLTPTGFSSAPFSSAQPAAASAAAAVQQALERTGVRGNVQAIPESRIVLRGAVESEQRKTELENAARQAAPGVRVDSELRVRRW